ncbi:MarR family winged helix-turn-helix transcriptional regulator [Brevibacterium casei]|uniref:MarR family winged helix-turn-helix transcriptional regulator n=1 Tax=Brevibacterium casei TaxID=33889 RepID=UPI003EBBC3C8
MPDETSVPVAAEATSRRVATRESAAKINQLILELCLATEGQGPQYSDWDLTGQQHSILERIAADPEVTSSDLAAELNVTKGAISQQLGVLEKGGYIARRRSEHDGRVQVLDLQERGIAYRDALANYEDILVDRYLERLSAEDIAEIVSALSKLRAAFTER